MRVLTTVLALITAAGLIDLLVLLVEQQFALLGLGAGLMLAGLAIAGLTEWVREALAAWASSARGNLATIVAGASGAIPLGALIGFVAVTYRVLTSSPGGMWARWLLAYLIAVGPWTVFSAYTRSRFSTLCRVHAFVGHLAFLVLSGGLRVTGGSLPMAMLAVVILALPAFVVDTLAARSGVGPLRVID